jgi:general stress protein YciG
MDRAKQREIASKGGKAAHQKGTAHEWTSEEARDAGRKGGIASHRRRREQQGEPMDASGGSAIAMDRDSSERDDMRSGGDRGSLAGSYGSERMSSDTEE